MLFQMHHASKSYEKILFDDIYFQVKSSEKIAIIGRNGCGKTTFLKCLCGLETLDKGDVVKQNKLRIGFLTQITNFPKNMRVSDYFKEAYQYILDLKQTLNDVEEQLKTDQSQVLLEKYDQLQSEFLKLNGYHYLTEVETVFTKFGFQKFDLEKNINDFSGGEKTKIEFVKLLISKPNMLILDEPTNHLDVETIVWLEKYLKNYPSAVIMVSHDRTFIDNVCQVIYELEFGQLTKYVGNYEHYVKAKQANIERKNKLYAYQQKEIERLEQQIEKFRFKKNKASFAQSKIKYLNRLERLEKVQEDDKTFSLQFTANKAGGKKVLEMEDLKVGYQDVLCTANLTIYKGDKIGIIGPNGCGKTTLLKTLANRIQPLGGEYLYGHQIEVAYFDQSLANENGSETVIENLWNDFPELEHYEVRKVLAQFLFMANDVSKPLSTCSGGEKIRLAFAKLFLKKANFLILDEPTNHLDIFGKEVLEEALKQFDGAILFVSHDRFFVKEIATSLYSIENKELQLVNEEYSWYQTKKPEKKKVNIYKQSQQPKQQLRKLEKRLSELEKSLIEKKEKMYLPENYEDIHKSRFLEEEIQLIQKEVDIILEKLINNHF